MRRIDCCLKLYWLVLIVCLLLQLQDIVADVQQQEFEYTSNPVQSRGYEQNISDEPTIDNDQSQTDTLKYGNYVSNDSLSLMPTFGRKFHGLTFDTNHQHWKGTPTPSRNKSHNNKCRGKQKFLLPQDETKHGDHKTHHTTKRQYTPTKTDNPTSHVTRKKFEDSDFDIDLGTIEIIQETTIKPSHYVTKEKYTERPPTQTKGDDSDTHLSLHDPKKINILCFGDSLTAGYNERGKDFFPYCSVLKKMLSEKSDISINVDIKGIVGEMTHKQMAFRLPLVLGNATSSYDWIIILGGTNDILHVKNFADDQYFLSQLENVWTPRITKDIEKLHEIAYKYNAKTLLLTVPENAIESWPEYRPLSKMRTTINEALKEFANSSNGRTVLCDTAKMIPRHSISSNEESLLWDDHVHLTRDGYIRLADAVFHCLDPYLPIHHKKRQQKYAT